MCGLLLILLSGFAQWQPAGGPYAPMVDHIAAGKGHILVSRWDQDGAPFVSNDNGEHWTQRMGGLSKKFYTVSPVVLDTFYFLTGGYDTRHVFRSGFNDTVWTALTNGFPAGIGYYQMACHLGKMYVSTSKGIYSSLDRGEHWYRDHKGIDSTYIQAFSSFDSTLFAMGSGDGKLYFRKAADTVWSVCCANLLTLGVLDMAVKDSVIYIGTISGVQRSVNKGQTWSWFNEGLGSQDARSLGIVGNMVCIAAGDSGFLKSEIPGTVWSKAANNVLYTFASAICVSDSTLYGGTLGSFYISHDSANSWTMKNNGLHRATVFSIAEKPPFMFAATSAGLFRSDDSAASWELLQNCPVGMGITNVTVLGNKIFAATYQSIAWVSSDNGDSWELINTGYTSSTLNSMYAFDTNVFVASAGIWRLNAAANFWSNVKQGGYAQCFASKDSLLFCGFWDQGILRSADHGDHWEAANSGIYINTKNATAMTTNARSIFASCGRLYRSDDDGLHWVTADGGLYYDSSMVSMTARDSIIYAATAEHVYSSYNAQAWGNVSQGLPEGSQLRQLLISGDTMFAATHEGVWKRPLDEMYFLRVRKNVTSLICRVGGCAYNEVYSNTSWVVEGAIPSWLEIDKMSGDLCDTLKFRVLEENFSTTARVANLTVTSPHAYPAHFSVIQDPHGILEANPDTLRLGYTAGFTDTVQLFSNTAWSFLEPLPVWLQCEKALKGTGNSMMVFKAKTANSSDSLRIIRFHIFSASADTITLDVIQSGEHTGISTFPGHRIMVYPNPAGHTINISGLEEMEPLSADLFDLEGRLILRNELVKGKTPSIELNGIPAGVYILKVRFSHEPLFKKVIVVK